MTYQDVLKFLAAEEVACYIPEGIAHSQAVLCHRNGKLTHRFFTYVLRFPTTKGTGPLAVLDLDAETGKLLEYTQCEDEVHDIDAAVPTDKAAAWKGIETYENLYPKVVELFEKSELSEEDRQVLRDFRAAFEQFVSGDLKAIYTQLAPEMFELLSRA